MNLRHFENAARQSWWLVHIEAWRQSGLDRTNYCRQHGLWKCTFDRWLKYLAGKEAARKHVEYQAELRRQKKLEAQEKRRLKRVRLRFSVSTNMRHRGLQAFWAMHVEAMNWSGMGVPRICSGAEPFADEPAQMARLAGRQRRGDRLAGSSASLRPSGR